jgi:hypothetical protein
MSWSVKAKFDSHELVSERSQFFKLLQHPSASRREDNMPTCSGSGGRMNTPFSAASHTGSPSNASPSRSRELALKMTTVVCGVAASVASASLTARCTRRPHAPYTPV